MVQGRTFYKDGKLMKPDKEPIRAVDLIIADYPDGLRVPGVSDPPHAVPNWNMQDVSFLKSVMQYSARYLHDDAVMLLFYPDSSTIKKEIMTYFKNFKLKVFDEWNVFQTLPLASHVNKSKTVSFQSISNSVEAFTSYLFRILT